MRPSPQTLARVAAVALVVAAGVVTAMRLSGGPAGEIVKVRVLPRPDDPMAADLVRCAELRRAAVEDWVCKRVWAQHRERFLDTSKPVPTKDQSRITNGAPDHTRAPADGPKEE